MKGERTVESKNGILQRVKAIFTRHPESVGESYIEHLLFAGSSGLKLTLAGIACMIHSVFPFVFINTASETMKKLTEKMTARKKEGTDI
jgi:hypothetical protein